MILLRTDWLTEGLMDFEYKKYVLLGYLLDAREHFKEKKLYPHLSHLERHRTQLHTIRENKKNIYKNLPRVASGIDFRHMRITYEEINRDAEPMQVIEEVIGFSLPKLEEVIAIGHALQKEVKRELNVFPVGPLSEYTGVGYIFIHLHYSNRVAIYEYETSGGTHDNHPNDRRIRTRLLGWEDCSGHTTLEDVKKKMRGRQRGNSNPHVLAVTCEGKYPIVPTLLPITEQILLQRLGHPQHARLLPQRKITDRRP